jgi:DNA modification methylase
MRNSPEVVQLPITEVKPCPRPVRVHNQKQRRKLKALLRRFGQVAPILVDAENVIIDGHAVHAALIELGFDEIAAVVVHNRSPEEIRALRLALNRLPQDAAWDQPVLREELQALLEIGFDMELAGFDAVEIDMSLAIDEPGTGAVEAEPVEDLSPPSGSIVTLGDVYQLGTHSVACGDARDAGLIRRLVGDRAVRVVFTDPPYNVAIDGFVSGLGKTRHADFAMASGELSKDAFIGFLADFLEALLPVLLDGAILFVCIDWRHVGELLEASTRLKLLLKNICVWTKSNAGLGTFYRSQHEFVFVLKFGDSPHLNNFELGQHGRTRSNVWAYRGVNSFGRDRMQLLEAHPTVKPVLMILDALKDVSRRGDVVLDPFLGSGSTLIAAEESGRSCVGIELEPAYVEVVIRRWERRTGSDAIHIATGETFTERVERIRSASAQPRDTLRETEGKSHG